MIPHADTLDFTKLVRPGDTILWTQGVGEPIACVKRLLAQAPLVDRFQIFLGASYSGLVQPTHTQFCDIMGMGAVGTNRQLCEAEQMEIVPCHLSDLPYLLSSGRLKIDIVIMQLSAADHSGRHSMGAVNGYVQYALDKARVSIAEINPNAPWTFSSTPPLSQFDHVVLSDQSLVDIPSRVPSGLDRKIARYVADEIEDGACLQIGIGTLPQAVLDELGNHRHLGLHSGVIGDGVVPLIEQGIIDNSRKEQDAGVSITGGLMGTSIVRNFAHKNASIRIEPVLVTHNPITLARLSKLTAINSAIEVDLTGQAGSELAGNRYMGTIGGQVDFVRGALASKGGRSILALPSRTPKGTSRIVSKLRSGVATVGRADADLVITEWGVASLRGSSISQRIQRMIAIAHPDDREQLEREAATLPGKACNLP